MKLLRVGQKGSEKPAALDKEGKIRDISSHIGDLNPEHVNFETMSKLQNVDLSSLPELEEIAAVAVYLAGDDATFTTGTTISVDGGISI